MLLIVCQCLRDAGVLVDVEHVELRQDGVATEAVGGSDIEKDVRCGFIVQQVSIGEIESFLWSIPGRRNHEPVPLHLAAGAVLFLRVVATASIILKQLLVKDLVDVFLVNPRGAEPVDRHLQNHQPGRQVFFDFLGRVIAALDPVFGQCMIALGKKRLRCLEKAPIQFTFRLPGVDEVGVDEKDVYERGGTNGVVRLFILLGLKFFDVFFQLFNLLLGLHDEDEAHHPEHKSHNSEYFH